MLSQEAVNVLRKQKPTLMHEVCPACNMTVPSERHLTVQTATRKVFICHEHAELWTRSVKEAAADICRLSDGICNSITGLGVEIQKISGDFSDQLASLAERLLDAIYNKAGEFRKLAYEKIAIFRQRLNQLAHFLGYPKTAAAYI